MKKLLAVILVTGAPVFGFSQLLSQVVLTDDTAKLVQLLHTGADPNKPDPNGTSPLMIACRWGKVSMIKILLENKATVDEPRSPKGRTPLMIACSYYGGITTARLLVQNGANVNLTAQDGSTALMLAAKNWKLDVVDYLLEKGADAGKKDSKGLTALDYANSTEDQYTLKSEDTDSRIDKEAVVTRLKSVVK